MLYPSPFSSCFVCLQFIYVEYCFVDRYDSKIFENLPTINDLYVDSYYGLSKDVLTFFYMISLCIISSNKSDEIKEVSGNRVYSLIKWDVIFIKCINA